MKGRKIKSESVPELAQPHAAGTTVRLVQPALHITYGSISVEVPLYWPFHHSEWHRAHQLLVAADTALLELPVDTSNQRSVDNNTELQSTLYLAGANVALHAILATHFLVVDIERTVGIRPNDETQLSTRLKRVLARIEFRDVAQENGWAKFIQLHKIRDAISHPKESNLYGRDDGSWAQIPIAWFASGHAIRASEAYLVLFEEIGTHWQKKRSDFTRTMTLSGLKRGLRSLHPAKKAVARVIPGTTDARPAGKEGDES